MTSNRSSVSSGYKKFHFPNKEGSNKKSSIFKFTPRNKDNPYDVSLLTKRSEKEDTSKKEKRETKTEKNLILFEKMLRKESKQLENQTPY